MFPEVYATHTDISFHPESEPKDFEMESSLFTESDCEFLENTFDLKNKGELEELIEMDESEFHRNVDEKEIADCMEDLIQGVEEMNEPKRSKSLTLWTNGEVVDDSMILSGPVALSVFNSDVESDVESDVSDAETESVAASEAEDDLEDDAAAEDDLEDDAAAEDDAGTVHNLQQEVLDLEDCIQQQQAAVDQKETELQRTSDELERIKHQYRVDMERMRKRMENKRPLECEGSRPAKRCRVERRGCPFCPFEQTTSGYDMRCLKDHMTNGDCTCPIDEMTSRTCSHSNVWCEEGESGWQSLKNMGFKDPDNHVIGFRHFSCPKCDFTHWHARKFKRHLQAGLNRGGCAYSKVDAEDIKNFQLKRKNRARV